MLDDVSPLTLGLLGLALEVMNPDRVPVLPRSKGGTTQAMCIGSSAALTLGGTNGSGSRR